MNRLLAVVLVAGALVFVSAAAAIPGGPAPNTPEWTTRETTNYARTTEAPNEQLANPNFETVWQLTSTVSADLQPGCSLRDRPRPPFLPVASLWRYPEG